MADPDVDSRFEEDDDDQNSGYESAVQSCTTSLASEFTKHKFVNGRRYHSYEAGRYVFPNDEPEKDRLDMVHAMVLMSLGVELLVAPVQHPRRILDIGAGTGLWAIDAGEKFPHAEVIGVDLSAIQPRWVPTNVSFIMDDIEKEWVFSRPFELIRAQGLYGAIRDWPRLVQNCYENTSEEGYCEFTDWDNHLTSPDASIPENSYFRRFNKMIVDELEGDAHPGPSLERWVKEAGYEIVSSQKYPLPFGPWAKDPKLKKIGTWNLMQLEEGLQGFATYVLDGKGWSELEIKVFCAKVQKELWNKHIHSMLWLYNVVGRKPRRLKPPATEASGDGGDLDEFP